MVYLVFYSGVWDYLGGPVKTQNHSMTEWISGGFLTCIISFKNEVLATQECDSNGISFVHIWHMDFAFKLKRQTDLFAMMQTNPALSRSPPPLYVDLAFFSLLVGDLSFWKRGRAEAQHNLIHLQPLGLLLPSLFSQPLKGERGYDCLCRVGGPSTTAEQCSNAGSVLTGSSWHWRAPLHHWSKCLCHKKSS